jgi:hypothetical protein
MAFKSVILFSSKNGLSESSKVKLDEILILIPYILKYIKKILALYTLIYNETNNY